MNIFENCEVSVEAVRGDRLVLTRTMLARDEYMTARRKQKRQGTLWQNRYWEHQIRDERNFARHVAQTPPLQA